MHSGTWMNALNWTACKRGEVVFLLKREICRVENKRVFISGFYISLTLDLSTYSESRNFSLSGFSFLLLTVLFNGLFYKLFNATASG